MHDKSPKLLLNVLLTIGLTGLLVAPAGIIARSALRNYQGSERVLGISNENQCENDYYNMEQIQKEITRLQIENEELKRTLNILRSKDIETTEPETVDSEIRLIQAIPDTFTE